MKLRVLIVDDEAPARQRLEDLLAKEEDVQLCGSLADGSEAVPVLRRGSLDLVFLDVQMPGLTGVEVVREVGAHAMPLVIFATAYDRYAVEAFELHAIDYLLKPFDDARFSKAMSRARNWLRVRQVGEAGQQLAALLQTLPLQTRSPVRSTTYLRRIAVKDAERTVVVAVEKIDYIQADGVYAELHVGDQVLLLRERMHALEAQLDPEEFVRIHRSTLARLDQIAALEPYFHGELVARLRSGAKLRVSRGQRAELEMRLGLGKAHS